MAEEHSKRLDHIRAKLSANEILFKTVAATLISFMALVVSAAQAWTALEERALLEIRTSLAEAQALPQFDISIKQSLNRKTGRFDDNRLVIKDDGGPVQQFTATPIVLLQVEAYATLNHIDQLKLARAPRGRLLSTKFSVLVSGYFPIQLISSVDRGLLVTMEGNRNNAKFVALADGVRQAAREEKWTAADIELRVYVRLSYLDLLGRAHHAYYMVPEIGAGWRLSKAQVSKLKKEVKGKWPVEFDNLSPPELLSNADARMKNP